MRYLRIQPDKWEKYQHYHDDRPVAWIKFYVSILDADHDVDYSLLPDAAKALLHHIWLLAAKTKNRIPYNREWISKAKLNLRSPIDLKPLIHGRFLEVFSESPIEVPALDHPQESSLDENQDSSTRARVTRALGSKSLSSSSSSKAEKETRDEFDAESAFEIVWRDYPDRVGRKSALKHFLATVRSDADLTRIRQALTNYLASDRVLRGYVQNGSTWFNNWQDWLDRKEPAKGASNGNSGNSTGGTRLTRRIERVAVADVD